MNTPLMFPSRTGKRQRGVVLVVSLLMLLVLTIIGLAATRSTTLEERMTANQNDAAVAFEAAEAALRDGEGQMSAANSPSFTSNANGAYDLATMGSTVSWRTIDWSSATKVKMYGGGITPTPYKSPSYFIVKLTSQYTQSAGSSLSSIAPLATKYTYYIFAHGYGVTSNTEVVLQSVYQE